MRFDRSILEAPKADPYAIRQRETVAGEVIDLGFRKRLKHASVPTKKHKSLFKSKWTQLRSMQRVPVGENVLGSRMEFGNYGIGTRSLSLEKAAVAYKQLRGYRRSRSRTLQSNISRMFGILSGSVEEKVVKLFLGRVETVRGEIAHVVLTDQKTRERLVGECEAALLARNSIAEGDEFECRVVQTSDGTKVVFNALRPKHVPPSRLDEIYDEIEAKLS